MQGALDALWHQLGATGDSEPTFALLEAGYAKPPRAYHTLEHVRWGLKRIDEILGSSTVLDSVNVPAVKWAMWFHDAVMSFDRKGDDDEERSGRLAFQEARRAGMSFEFSGEVLRLVLATSHLADDLQPDEALLVDADLSMLGASETDFSAYEQRVREEWAHVDDEAFAAVRIAVLERFLGKPRIFTTDYARARWEARAQANLRRSVQQLKGHP